MPIKKRFYTKRFKHTVMMHAGRHTLADASKKFGVHMTLIDYWLNNALGLPQPAIKYASRKRLAKRVA